MRAVKPFFLFLFTWFSNIALAQKQNFNLLALFLRSRRVEYVSSWNNYSSRAHSDITALMDARHATK